MFTPHIARWRDLSSPKFRETCRPYIRPHGMTHSNQILHGDQTIDEKKNFTGSTTPNALVKVFV